MRGHTDGETPAIQNGRPVGSAAYWTKRPWIPRDNQFRLPPTRTKENTTVKSRTSHALMAALVLVASIASLETCHAQSGSRGGGYSAPAAQSYATPSFSTPKYAAPSYASGATYSTPMSTSSFSTCGPNGCPGTNRIASAPVVSSYAPSVASQSVYMPAPPVYASSAPVYSTLQPSYSIAQPVYSVGYSSGYSTCSGYSSCSSGYSAPIRYSSYYRSSSCH